MKNGLRKIIAGVLLLAFGFSMQSFIGVRIEKRHYRKGYYVHIWHNPKTKPVHAATEKVVGKEEKQESKPVVQAKKQEASPSHDQPQRSHDDQLQRNIAPVSRALDN